MLTRKQHVGKRQNYRRLSAQVKSVLKEIQDIDTIAVTETPKHSNFNSPCLENSFFDFYSIDSNFLAQNSSTETSTEKAETTFNKLEIDINSNDNNFISKNETKRENSLKTLLAQWALNCNVSQVAVNKILHILFPFHPDLPLNYRTLIKTPVLNNKKQLLNGEYCHIGLKYVLNTIINIDLFAEDSIILSFGIDGLQLFSSNNTQLWPISCLIKNSKFPVFIVGLFCGTSKPKPLSIYLEDLITELSELIENGIRIKHKSFNIVLHSFICDAPAKAYVKCIKSPGGYSACDKCEEVGEYHGRVTYPGIRSRRRTDQSFFLQVDKNHHLAVSPLTDLNIGMVSIFPIDYMHNVCLGVTKKLLYLWAGLSRTGNRRLKLSTSSEIKISDTIKLLKPYITSDFNRKPRGFNELAHWKATEYRTFLIYIGPLVLKNNINLAVYENFLLLHTAISILLSKNHISNVGTDLTRVLLNTFIEHSKKIYGIEFSIYNVHALCHLPDEVDFYGPLDTFSAFPFENYFCQVKALVKSPNKPLEQIYRRLNENLLFAPNLSENTDFKVLMEHASGPICQGIPILKQYAKLNFGDSKFCTKNHSSSDSYFLTSDNSVVQIENILLSTNSKILILGRQFTSSESFYNYPIDSKIINISIVSNLSASMNIWSIENLVGKVMLLPNTSDKKWLCLPMLHTI